MSTCKMRLPLGLLLCASLACAGARPPAARPAPAFSASTLDGEARSFPEGPRGRATLLAFWASWCSACKEELPRLLALSAREQGRLDLVGVNVDPEPEQGRAYARAAGLSCANLADGELRVADLFGVKKTPTLLLIDRQGAVTYVGHAADEALERAVLAAVR